MKKLIVLFCLFFLLTGKVFAADYGLSCDGTNDHAQWNGGSKIATNGTMSFEFKVKFNSVAGTPGFFTDEPPDSPGAALYWDNGGNVLKFLGDTNGYISQAITDFSTDTWYEVYYGHDNATGTSYFGVDGDVNSVSDGQTYAGGKTKFYICRMYWGYLNGAIDEFRVSSNVRHTTDYTPITTPYTSDGNTLHLWHFDEGTGATANDSAGTAHLSLENGAGWTSGYQFTPPTPTPTPSPSPTPTPTPWFHPPGSSPTPTPTPIQGGAAAPVFCEYAVATSTATPSVLGPWGGEWATGSIPLDVWGAVFVRISNKINDIVSILWTLDGYSHPTDQDFYTDLEGGNFFDSGLCFDNPIAGGNPHDDNFEQLLFADGVQCEATASDQLVDRDDPDENLTTTDGRPLAVLPLFTDYMSGAVTPHVSVTDTDGNVVPCVAAIGYSDTALNSGAPSTPQCASGDFMCQAFNFIQWAVSSVITGIQDVLVYLFVPQATNFEYLADSVAYNMSTKAPFAYVYQFMTLNFSDPGGSEDVPSFTFTFADPEGRLESSYAVTTPDTVSDALGYTRPALTIIIWLVFVAYIFLLPRRFLT